AWTSRVARLRVLSGREVCGILGRHGFVEVSPSWESHRDAAKGPRFDDDGSGARPRRDSARNPAVDHPPVRPATVAVRGRIDRGRVHPGLPPARAGGPRRPVRYARRAPGSRPSARVTSAAAALALPLRARGQRMAPSRAAAVTPSPAIAGTVPGAARAGPPAPPG